jgi:hypothetical protein
LFPDINKGQFIKEMCFGLEILCGNGMKGWSQMVGGVRGGMWNWVERMVTDGWWCQRGNVELG